MSAKVGWAVTVGWVLGDLGFDMICCPVVGTAVVDDLMVVVSIAVTFVVELVVDLVLMFDFDTL